MKASFIFQYSGSFRQIKKYGNFKTSSRYFHYINKTIPIANQYSVNSKFNKYALLSSYPYTIASSSLTTITATRTRTVVATQRFFSTERSGGGAVEKTKRVEILQDLTAEDDIESSESGQKIRPKMRVQDVLSRLEPKKYTIDESTNIIGVIDHLMDEKLASCLAITKSGEISGIITARDILHFIRVCLKQQREGGIRLSNALAETPLKKIITKKEHLIYCSPRDSLKRCREIMFQCKVRNLPVIIDGQVTGIITAKLLADASFDLNETGGKKGFIYNVTGRKGLPEGTKFDHSMVMRNINETSSSSNQEVMKLDIEIGSFALPHPFKRADGIAMNHRQFGAHNFSEDLTMCEDAHFALKLPDPLATSEASDGSSSRSHLVYLCVADGVGSWRQYDVDPRAYSHRLVGHARNVIEADIQHRELLGQSPFDRDLDPIHPLDVIMDAWNLTTNDGIVGSSTICVATIDKKLNQISYSNIGDCGLMVIRHIDSETAGYMRERKKPRDLRKSDLRIRYLSQQQLRSFNLPYQLGYTNIEGTPNSFETPTDSDTASIPIMPGDTIILATDGLFDNLDLDEIVDEVSEWDNERNTTNDVQSRTANELAEQLVRKARELSLDKQRDSPFAILAKENDIMWGGGMPDDTTVIVACVRTASS